jgi:uncharacterized protein
MSNIKLTLALILIFAACSEKIQYVQLPMPYPASNEPAYENFNKHSEYVPMSDSTKIAVDIFIPSQGDENNQFPVILSYTPYQRAHINHDTGEIYDQSANNISRFLLSHGYALVAADMRGTGASTGWLLDFMPEIWRDGKELVDWIAAQSWSNGNVGMMGGSYLGWSQTATASQKPDALKCIMPAVIPLEGYTGEVYPGGIYLNGFMQSWSSFMYYSVRNNYRAGRRKITTAPVADEDGDGELVDEIPLDLNENGSFLDENFPPVYSDGNPREHIYYNLSLLHHKKNYDYSEWAKDIYYYDGKSPLGYRVDELGPTAHIKGIMESGIPIYHVGGWFDGFTRGSFELFATMKKTNPSKIIMGPGYHNYSGGPFWEFFGISKETAREIFKIEHLRFFDRYLKGKDNGIENEPSILLYVMNGGGWRFEKEWPLKRQKLKKYYFSADKKLAATPGTNGQSAYQTNYSHSSSYGKNDGNRWLGIAGNEPNSLPYRNSHDKKTLYFETDTLLADIEVTGHPVVFLSLSSNADYGDIFVYLNDVDQTGNSLLVTEGQLRAGFANLYNSDEMIKTHSGIDVQPDLPWHGYNKDQYIDKVFADGKIVDLSFDLHPTSWVFKRGHKMRLSIGCSDFPTFRLHPKLVPGNDPKNADKIVPTITVFFGKKHNSFLELPVIPLQN